MPNVPLTMLMTVRNGEPYLEEAVKSVLSQTYGDFQFLILDNASTDRSREIVRGFQDARVRLVELECDLGQTAALNRGLALVDTPYIARMDADDISHPARLERQMLFLREYPEVALLGTWYETIDREGWVTARCPLPVSHAEILKALLFENQFAHSSVVYSRQRALNCGGYNARFKHAQDYALWWQIASTSTVANYPEFLVQIRTHPGQATLASQVALASEAFQVVRDALRQPGMPEEVQRLARRVRGHACLKYAAGLSECGQRLRSVFWLMRGLFSAPALISNRGALNYVALALLGKRGYDALRSLKHLLWKSQRSRYRP